MSRTHQLRPSRSMVVTRRTACRCASTSGSPHARRAGDSDRHAGAFGDLGQLACSDRSVGASEQEHQVPAVRTRQDQLVLQWCRQPSSYGGVVATANRYDQAVVATVRREQTEPVGQCPRVGAATQYVGQEVSLGTLGLLGGLAAEEQHQGGDNGGTLDDALVRIGQVVDTSDHQCAEPFAFRGRRDHPAVTDASQPPGLRLLPRHRRTWSTRTRPQPARCRRHRPGRPTRPAARPARRRWRRRRRRTARSRRTGRARRPRARSPHAPADSWSSAAAVSAAARTCTIVTAASAASEPSSDTSSRLNGRRVRLEANSTPTKAPSTISGVPQIATSPSSPTASSIGEVCRKRRSAG